GTGPASNLASATTYDVPAAPSLTATRGPGAGNITLTWTKPTTGGLPITGYVCGLMYDGGATSKGCGRYQATTRDGGVSCGPPSLTCHFRVSAGDDAGYGPYSNVAFATTYDRPTPPHAGAGSGPDYGQVHVAWNGATTDGLPITGYLCQISYDGGATWGGCGI